MCSFPETDTAFCLLKGLAEGICNQALLAQKISMAVGFFQVAGLAGKSNKKMHGILRLQGAV